jgi:hypothetical protein
MMGRNVAKMGIAGRALEPIRHGLTAAFGTIIPKVASRSLTNWGSQYTVHRID